MSLPRPVQELQIGGSSVPISKFATRCGTMAKITYIEHDGTSHTVEAEVGATVMETALRNGITGIVAECGGSCTCATCHVYVDEAWFDKLGPRSEDEEYQLDSAYD